eukprot:10048802-Heterocapsa_arctica.AAC.1
MTPKAVAPPIFHLRPPPPKPHMRAYVRPEVAPPRPWCERHPTSCYLRDCAACAQLMAWHNQFAAYPASLREWK